MIMRLGTRILSTVDTRCLMKFAWNFGYKGMRSVQKFKKRLKSGVVFPPFLYLSIINSCNLRCQGCWVDVAAERTMIPLDELDRLIHDAKAHGNSFFGILGGEPFMHPDLLTMLERHPDCYFQLFTNGQFITDDIARRLRELGNATPLISIEGTDVVSDQRRGRLGVLNKTLRGLENCLKHKVLTGVATSVCQTNIDDLVNESWLDRLIEMGAHYVWFHTYRPVGPESTPELALSPEQLMRVRQFIVNMRCTKAIGIVDAYYDDKGQALCPAATGISHHIGPGGHVEPCPIVQFAKENIRDERGIFRTLTESNYLSDFRDLARKSTRGCIVLERPDLLKAFAESQKAGDSTLRGTAAAELAGMTGRHSQYLPEFEPVPEKHWMYRLAKKHFFTDFGAYADFQGKSPARPNPDRSEAHAHSAATG